MRIRFEELKGRSIAATDGDIGKVDDVYFDDSTGKVRYLVVDTRRWLPERKVLLDPVVFQTPLPSSDSLPVDLTKEKVKTSPDIDTEKPISKREQADLHIHYGWPLYFGGGSLSSARTHGTNPQATASGVREGERPPSSAPGMDFDETEDTDPHLRSAREVDGYALTSAEEEIGRVRDLVLDTEAWEIRELLVRGGEPIEGREAAIPFDQIRSIHWTTAQVRIDPESKERL